MHAPTPAYEANEADLAYWKIRLHDVPDSFSDVAGGKTVRAHSKCISHDIAREDFRRLKSAAPDSSAQEIILALTYVAVSRLYGVNDIILGLPLHDSPTAMPFRMTFKSDLAMAELLNTVPETLAADRAHGKFPFSSLNHLTGREPDRALFDLIFDYIPAESALCIGDSEESRQSPWAIRIRETHDGSSATLTIALDPELVDVDDGFRLARCLHHLLTSPLNFTHQAIGKIPIVSDEDRHHLLAELNDTDIPVPVEATLVSLCASQARRNPDAIAVTHGTQSITYAELHAKADAVALRLAKAGVGPEVIVGVAMPRNIELIVTLLAIHKAGGAYLPLDPALPGGRIAYIISDTQVRLIVTTRALAEKLPETTANRIFLDDPDSCDAAPAIPAEGSAARPENLAYVIYTSGSTGFPKGVAIEHRNAVNFVLWQVAQLEPNDLSGILLSMSLSFDFSIDEIFVSLAGGGRLIIVENLLALPTAPALGEVRVLSAVSSVFDALLQIGGFPPGVRLIRFGGEALPRSLVDRVLAIDPNVRIRNQYGPTETTVFSTCSPVCPADTGEPSIGKPIWNTKLYVLDQNRELLPKGAKGELYIGGAGVARGYLNKPELTSERFVKSPFGGGRLYRTGDIVRWRNDGGLDFFHRIDAQVKINGLRIELGEIEKQLESLPGIASAIAVVRPDNQGAKRIFAFAVPHDMNNRPDTSAVNKYLGERLPGYMVPAALTWIETLPLTSSGKLDRNALSVPDGTKSEQYYRAPSNAQELSLASIWSQVLKIPQIGIDDDFFQLGGTSLQASIIFARIAQTHGLDLPASTMVSAPTIARQAARLTNASPASDAKLIAFRETGSGPPLFFLHGGGGGIMFVRDIVDDFKSRNPLYGVPPAPLDGTQRLPPSIAKIAASYITQIRKVQPAGPYHFVGWSFGGTVAYEMAQQLREAGETTEFLGLIDTHAGLYRLAGQANSVRASERQGQVHNRPLIKRIASKVGDLIDRTRKSVKKMPNNLRHRLGLPIPHDARTAFYLRKFIEAEKAYEPKAYEGKITMFTRKGASEWHKAHWSKLASGGLIIHELPVERHLEIIRQPNSRFLAMSIDACLKNLGSGDKSRRA